MSVARCSGLYGGHRLVDRRRVLDEVLGAESLQVLEVEDPLAVRRAVEGDDPDHVREMVALLPQLVDLRIVLGEDDARAAVGHDERDVLGDASWGRRWWSRRRRT